MTFRGRAGRMATIPVLFMIMGCAETPKQPPAPPPPAPQATAPRERPAMTQEREKAADEMQLIREKMRADKKLLVSQNMGLTDAEAQKFWPIYDRYQVDLGRLFDRQLEIIETFAGNYEAMSDAVAKKLLDDYLALEDEQFALQQSYLPKFRGVLSERKVARYYQIENKLKAIVDLDLAANIPLVE